MSKNKQTKVQMTVYDATYNLLRTLGLTTFFGNPYVAAAVPELPVMLLTYDFYDQAEASAVRAIAGEAAIGGRLPIGLSAALPAGFGIDRPQR